MRFDKPKRKRPRREIGGVMFTCLSPGAWLSDDHRLAIVHMCVGRIEAAWELYETALGKFDPANLNDTDFLCGDHICSSIDLGGRGLADDVIKLSKAKHATL